jgi:hypothetical protein
MQCRGEYFGMIKSKQHDKHVWHGQNGKKNIGIVGNWEGNN